MPEFKFNLVSIPKLCADMICSVVFNGDHYFQQRSSMKPTLLGSLKEGPYCVDLKLTQDSTLSVLLDFLSPVLLNKLL